jgi:mono/diheme cytochrome c family protein
MKSEQRSAMLAGLIIGVVAAAAAGGLLFFLLFPLALKHRTSWPLEDAIGTNRVLAAIPAEYKRMDNPLSPDAQTLSAGQTVYLGNCSVCHGAGGAGDADIGRNMYPPAADLTSKRVIDMNDGEIAWIVKFGLSFVGMPAFRTILDDREVWQVVTFIRSLEPGGAAEAAPTATAPAVSTGQPPGTVSAPELARGRAIFAQKGCAGCHGENAGGGVGPALTGTALSLDAVTNKVRSGSGAMPAFDRSTLSNGELKQIYQWLESSP